jgi:DNA repair photolyase
LKHQFPVTIQTKSTLVLRDIDLIKKFSQRQIGFTITALDDTVRKQFEPNSSPVQEKLQALEELHANGIKTYAFLGPILPYLSDQNLEETIHTIANTGVSYIYADKLNMKPGLWPILNKFLNKDLPDLHTKWQNIFLQKNNYYEELKTRINDTCRQIGLECKFCY